jgi:3-methylcrotonyl-CoA carboxylase alpha subunit
MRLVEDAAGFADALTSCQRVAASSFGNDHVLIEKYIQRPRHIEVQVFGDTHGNVVHLFERDCSLQRRHQKVIEEAPAPGMDEATRAELCAAAVRAARAVDYVGAGTIEFIADGSAGLSADRIWFMEMNTRLQVEHPVTEEITGVDLVEWQLRVASGEPLPKTQDELEIDGWAMEARLYAEDPATGFLPSTGPLDVLSIGWSEGSRIDTGVEEGGAVTPFYDPMIAKVIARGATRDEAMARLEESLAGTMVWPVKTNAAFLVSALRHPEFAAGAVDTGLIARDGEAMAEPPAPSDHDLTQAARWIGRETTGFSPLAEGLFGFRLNREPSSELVLNVNGRPTPFAYASGGPFHSGFRETGDPLAELMCRDGATYLISPWRSEGSHGGAAGDGSILSPMPGRVIAVEVAAGDAVVKGQKLLTLEAMKMEHTLTAPFDGTVAELNAAPGAQVQVEALLARIEAAAE